MISRLCCFLAPAEEAVEYSVGVFTTGKGEQKSIYQGIGNQTDQAWKDLYDRMSFRSIFHLLLHNCFLRFLYFYFL